MIGHSGTINDIYLSDKSPKDKPWDTHRANAELVEKLYEGSDFQGYANRIHYCSRFLGFALKAESVGEIKLKLREVRFCHVRHCSTCQWRRSVRWLARFIPAMPKILERYPTSRWIFLTLTVRNCPVTDLKTTLQQMNKAWKRLIERKSFPALGFIKSVEVTRAYDCYHNQTYLGRHGLTWIDKWEKTNKKTIRAVGSPDAHPHFHVLMLVPSSYFAGRTYINQKEWRNLWQSALQADYLPVVNVKAVKPKTSEPPDTGIFIALCETLKYSVKLADLTADQEWLIEITKQLYKTRAIAIGGVLKDYVSSEEVEPGLDGDGESEEGFGLGVDVWFGWREMVKRYAKVDNR